MNQQHFTNTDILQLDKRFRTNLINSLGGFKSANLIGTFSKQGNTNLAIFSSVVHIGANPPLMGMISRPNSVPRHTLENIVATEQFTINHVHKRFFRNAHQTAARYDANISEFDATQLTPEFIDTIDNFNAPFVQEARIKIGLQLSEIIDIQLNNTKMIIGEVVYLALPENIIAADGYIDIEQAGTVAISGLDNYHTTQRLERLPYAKPVRPLV